MAIYSVTVSNPQMASLVAHASGQTDIEKYWLVGNQLFVKDVDQQSLQDALASVSLAFDPLEQPRKAQMCVINQAYESEFSAIKAQYPESERESWPVQLAEASALASDSQASTPFLSGLCLSRGFGETVSELADKVRTKNDTYVQFSFALTGKRHRLERQIMEAASVQDIASVTWDSAQ